MALRTEVLGNNDDTVIQRRPPTIPGRRRTRWLPAAGVVAAMLLVGGGVGLWLLEVPPSVVPPSLVPPSLVPSALTPLSPTPAVAPVLPTATEAEINGEMPGDPRVVRFAPNPNILVLDFASLEQQGAMLNRAAALIEKAGTPRDRVLSDRELADVIAASGTTAATFYYGHDYRVSDLARLFVLADRDHVPLDADEERLRRMLDAQGLLKPGAVGGLISLPALGSDKFVDSAGRATILHHELSHGEYFTSPAYVAYVTQFWQDVLTEQERSLFRKFLSEDGYDAGIEDLMRNEMQAYLMHTRDPRFFTARAVGIPQDRINALQAQFLLGMPPGWLRDCTTAPGVK